LHGRVSEALILKKAFQNLANSPVSILFQDASFGNPGKATTKNGEPRLPEGTSARRNSNRNNKFSIGLIRLHETVCFLNLCKLKNTRRLCLVNTRRRSICQNLKWNIREWESGHTDTAIRPDRRKRIKQSLGANQIEHRIDASGKFFSDAVCQLSSFLPTMRYVPALRSKKHSVLSSRSF
jgi:hypothetical protein